MDDFQATAPSGARVDLVELPPDMSDYSELASHFEKTLRLGPESILIAESFSGPLAIMLAERTGVAALVLCNTFANAPYFGAFAVLPLPLIARIPPPKFLVRYFIVGRGAPDSMVKQVLQVVERVSPDIMARRARSALRVDVTRELSRCTCPILCLHGTHDHVIRTWSLATIVREATAPVTVVDIAGPHLLLKTAPREAWSAIEAFLSAPTPPAPAPSPRSY